MNHSKRSKKKVDRLRFIGMNIKEVPVTCTRLIAGAKEEGYIHTLPQTEDQVK